MRILLLTQYYAPEVGASQVRLAAFCRELRLEGHAVEVVTAMPHHPAGCIFPEYRGKFYSREVRDGVVIHRVWLYVAAGAGAKRILNYLSFALLCLCSLIRAQKPDYVFVDSPPLFLALPGWLASRMWRVPFIFNVADLWPDSVIDLGVMRPGLTTKLGFALEKWTYKHADFITAVTEGIRSSLLNNKCVPPEKILFLPNGVHTRLFDPLAAPDEELRAQLGLQGKKVILYAGNHGYAGGVDQLIDAAALTSDPTVHFLLVGDGPEKPMLKARAQELGLQNVTFLDFVPIERLPAFLSITSLAAVTLRKSPITRGARPAKAFVMMAAGKPIVLAAEGDGEAAALIRRAKAGIVVAPQAPQQFADALRFLLASPQLATRMGVNGRAFVQAYFDWPSLIRNWLVQLAAATPHESAQPARSGQKSTATTPTS